MDCINCFLSDTASNPGVAILGAVLMFVIQRIVSGKGLGLAVVLEFLKDMFNGKPSPAPNEPSKPDEPARDPRIIPWPDGFDPLKDRPVLRALRDVLAELLRRKFAEKALTFESFGPDAASVSDDEAAVKQFLAALKALDEVK